jgi:hypothetical protein
MALVKIDMGSTAALCCQLWIGSMTEIASELGKLERLYPGKVKRKGKIKRTNDLANIVRYRNKWFLNVEWTV